MQKFPLNKWNLQHFSASFSCSSLLLPHCVVAALIYLNNCDRLPGTFIGCRPLHSQALSFCIILWLRVGNGEERGRGDVAALRSTCNVAAAARVQCIFLPQTADFSSVKPRQKPREETSAGRGKVLMSPTRALATLRCCQHFLFASTTGHSAYVKFFTYVTCNDNSSHVAARMCRRLLLHSAT